MVMWLQLTIIVGVLGAGAVWWLAANREGNAASAALRKKQSDKRARFNRGQGVDDAPAPAMSKGKARTFGTR